MEGTPDMPSIPVSWTEVNNRLSARARRDRRDENPTPRLAGEIAECAFAEVKRSLTRWSTADGSLSVAAKMIAESAGYRDRAMAAHAAAAEACAETVLVAVSPTDHELISPEQRSDELIDMMRVSIGAALANEFATADPNLVSLNLIDLGLGGPVGIETVSGSLFDYTGFSQARSSSRDAGSVVEGRVASAIVDLLDHAGPFLPFDQAIRAFWGVGLADIMATTDFLQRSTSSHPMMLSAQAGSSSVTELVTLIASQARHFSIEDAAQILDLMSMPRLPHRSDPTWRPWERLHGLRLSVCPIARGISQGVDTVILAPELLNRSIMNMFGYSGQGQWFQRSYRPRSRSDQQADDVASAASNLAQTIDGWYEEAVAASIKHSSATLVVESTVRTERDLVGSAWKGHGSTELREGDIDVLVVDPHRCSIAVLECKHPHQKFRPTDIARLLEDCFVGPKSYVARSERRVARVVRDLPEVLAKRGLHYTNQWTVDAAIVTEPESPLLFWIPPSAVPAIADEDLASWLARSTDV